MGVVIHPIPAFGRGTRTLQESAISDLVHPPFIGDLCCGEVGHVWKEGVWILPPPTTSFASAQPV